MYLADRMCHEFARVCVMHLRNFYNIGMDILPMYLIAAVCVMSLHVFSRPNVSRV